MFTVIKFAFFLFYPVNVFLKMYVTFCTNLYVEMYKYWQFTDLVKKKQLTKHVIIFGGISFGCC